MAVQTLANLLESLAGSRFHAEARLLTWHPRGVFDDAVAARVVDLLESEESLGGDPFNCFTDLSGLSEIRMRIGHLASIASRRHSAFDPPKSAFFANSSVAIGICRIYEEFMQDACIQVRVFRGRPEAAEWLGVPAALLEDGPDGMDKP